MKLENASRKKMEHRQAELPLQSEKNVMNGEGENRRRQKEIAKGTDENKRQGIMRKKGGKRQRKVMQKQR